MRGRFIVAALAAAFTLAACGPAGSKDVGTASASAEQARADDGTTLSGVDLDIASANCNAYEAAVYDTRVFHQRLGLGSVRSTIGAWMDMYQEARDGIEFSSVPSHPQITQAFTAVAKTYDESLEKLDHYTGSTDMSDEVMRWNDQDERVTALCERLPQVP